MMTALRTLLLILLEFYDRVDGDMSMGFGGLRGRGAKKQDAPVERELALTLEELYHGCTKKMKISRHVSRRTSRHFDQFRYI